jgi:hypothetical protein
MNLTPFFPAWRPRLAPLGQRVQRLRRHSLLHLDSLFGALLPSWLLAQAEQGPNSRQHIYSVRRTFFGFLYQVLNPDCPCRVSVGVRSDFSLSCFMEPLVRTARGAKSIHGDANLRI